MLMSSEDCVIMKLALKKLVLSCLSIRTNAGNNSLVICYSESHQDGQMAHIKWLKIPLMGT